MNEGSLQADRSRVEPAYLTTGDPGFNGGGTLQTQDPAAMMSGYENVFGPAARDIKWDSQRHKRHQRWHLPDALKGSNAFLTDRVDGLITDATSSPFTKNILPYMYKENPDGKIKWNVYSFDEGLASRVPYEAAARVLPQSKRTFAGYAVRQGLAIQMEHNFMMRPEGMENFRHQLTQLVGSIQLTNDLDVHMALLHAPSYQKHMDEKYQDSSRSVNSACRMYIDLFGFMQKNENALDYLIEDARNHLKAWGSKPPTFMLCNGALTRQLTMTPEKTNYITQGVDGQRKLAQGPDLPSYRGLQIINTRQFSLEAGMAPRDMLRRRVRVCEHYFIPWEPRNIFKRFEFYDQSRDSMFYRSWFDLYKAGFPKTVKDVEFMMSKLAGVGVEETLEEDAQPQNELDDTGDNAAQEEQEAQDSGFSEYAIGAKAFLKLSGVLDHKGKWLKDANFVVEINTPFQEKPAVQIFTVTEDMLLQGGGHEYFRKFLQRFFEEILPCFAADPDPRTNAARANPQRAHPQRANAARPNPQRANPQRANDVDDDAGEQAEAEAEAYGKENLETDVMQMMRELNGEKNQSLLQYFGIGQCKVKVRALASDLFLLRPCIEHYMLGVIIGRGGGPEDLGATFWGQTELSCYDDAQHGIWGMSYKYHERAVVTNEKNLIRVFDVAFDGYCGGNDSQILEWSETGVNNFSECCANISDNYMGPSMIVMTLPVRTNSLETFPNPILLFSDDVAYKRPTVVPDRNIQYQHGERHRVFSMLSTDKDDHIIATVYKYYYTVLSLGCLMNSFNSLAAGELAYQGETDVYGFSFHGHMASIVDGHREETQGSGHLGPNFVGVASVREGRGIIPRGMPMLQHLV